MISSRPNILIVDHKFILKVQNVTKVNLSCTLTINKKVSIY